MASTPSPTESLYEGALFALTVLSVPATLGLIARRRLPTAVALANVLTNSAAAPVAIYTLAAYGKRGWWPLAGASASAAAFSAVGTLWARDQVGNAWLLSASFVLSVVFGVALPLMLGLYVKTRRALIANLRLESERLARERDLMVLKARTEERARLAREMHDVVAHRVSLMVVHAGALRLAFGDGAPQARQSAELVASTGRQALDELRQIIGVLRMHGTGEDDPAARGPMPDLGKVEDLVNECRAAGMTVALTVTGERPALGAAVEHAAYRVAQEGLTNVRKHAGSAQADVRISYREDGVDVSIDNERPPRANGLSLPGSGFGLVGLRERVSALGGTFSAGVRSDGGFRISAHLPAVSTAAADAEPLSAFEP